MNLHGHSRRNEKEEESRTRMTTDDDEEQICLINDGRGVGEDGNDEGQNHDHVERGPCLRRNQQKFSRGVICRTSRDSH